MSRDDVPDIIVLGLPSSVGSRVLEPRGSADGQPVTNITSAGVQTCLWVQGLRTESSWQLLTAVLLLVCWKDENAKSLEKVLQVWGLVQSPEFPEFFQNGSEKSGVPENSRVTISSRRSQEVWVPKGLSQTGGAWVGVDRSKDWSQIKYSRSNINPKVNKVQESYLYTRSLSGGRIRRNSEQDRESSGTEAQGKWKHKWSGISSDNLKHNGETQDK